MADEFLAIDKDAVKRKMQLSEVELIDIPRKYSRQNLPLDKRIRAIKVDNKLTPFLCCNACKSVHHWYKLDEEKSRWINMSGIKGLKNHLSNMCPKVKEVPIQRTDGNIKNLLQSMAKGTQ